MSTTPATSADQFLMGGGPVAAKFENIGDSHTGTIVDPPEVRQQTDIVTNEPVFWPSGDPKMQLLVTVQTDQRDSTDDDGKRRLYIKGKSLTEAVREAVRKTGAGGLEVGGTLTVTYIGDGTASQRGFNPPKLYSASYSRPDTSAASGAFLGVPEPERAPETQPAAAPTSAQLAALKAAGIDPATVFPGYNPPPF